MNLKINNSSIHRRRIVDIKNLNESNNKKLNFVQKKRNSSCMHNHSKGVSMKFLRKTKGSYKHYKDSKWLIKGKSFFSTSRFRIMQNKENMEKMQIIEQPIKVEIFLPQNNYEIFTGNNITDIVN